MDRKMNGRVATSVASRHLARRAPRLLIVDATVDEREMYAEYFRSRGFCTLQAATAADGYRLAVELQPAVVVTEARLAGCADILAFVRQLKGEQRTQFAPIVVLSSIASDGELSTRPAGCDRFLMKPCLPEALGRAVDEVLLDTNARTTAAS